MKLTHTLLAAALGAAIVLSLSACNSSGSGSSSKWIANPSSAAVATSAAPVSLPGSAAHAHRMDTPAAGSQAMAHNAPGTNWFGGPIYHGKPNLALTAALIKAGGGADNFSFHTAWVSMLGEKTVNAEVDKLRKEYGKGKVGEFMIGMTFVVNDGLKHARAEGITLPPPANLSGKALAKALVKAGTTPKGTFWAGFLFDHAVSHKIHNEVMTDIDGKFSHAFDGTTHRILNQAMYDVAEKLAMKNVDLAAFH